MTGRMRTAPSVAGAMAEQLLRRARAELDCAYESHDPSMRFLHAHMAAIRSASAVLAMNGPGPRRRGRVLSVWEQLSDAGEQWQGWAAAFAAGASIRAGIESGRVNVVDADQALLTLEHAEAFREEVAGVVRASRSAATPAMAS
jgi:hypothetical protein